MDDNQIRPGQTYSPGGQSQPATNPVAAPPGTPAAPVPDTPAAPVQAPMPAPPIQAPLAEPHQAPVEAPVQPPTATGPAAAGNGTNHNAIEQAKEQAAQNSKKDNGEAVELEPEEVLFSWNAPEFTYISKPAGWYGVVALVAIVLAGGLAYFRQWVAVVLVLVMGLAMAIVGSRRPRTLNYTITNYGVYIGEKPYPYDDFKAHYEGHDYGQQVLELVPAKRFAPLVSLPVPPQQQADIFAAIEEVLPKTEPINNVVDKIFTYFRF